MLQVINKQDEGDADNIEPRFWFEMTDSNGNDLQEGSLVFGNLSPERFHNAKGESLEVPVVPMCYYGEILTGALIDKWIGLFTDGPCYLPEYKSLLFNQEPGYCRVFF